MSIIIIWRLKSVEGQLSDRLNVFAGQNESLPVLSDSPAAFAKTEVMIRLVSTFICSLGLVQALSYDLHLSTMASETEEKLSFLPCVWLMTVATVTSTFSPSTPLSWPCLILDMHVKEIATVHSTSFSK